MSAKRGEVVKILALAGYTADYLPPTGVQRSFGEGSPPPIGASRAFLTASLLQSIEATTQHIEQADRRLRRAQAVLQQLLAIGNTDRPDVD